MILLFRCGHQGRHKDGHEPVCAECGTRGIARVVQAPAPRFVGLATGPHATTRALDPAVVRIGQTPLTLRQETADV